MKATKNMNIAEIKAALDKYTAKHPVTDKFDLQGLQLCEYAENIRAAVQTGNNETVSQIAADIYNYGFMNGAKQTTDKYNKVFNKLSATLSDMFHHYCNGGEGIPEGYEERIQYFFENIQGIDNVRLRTVYFAAVVDCMNMLVKLGYIKI